LIEALPYIKTFKGKTFVIKYGGSIMSHEKAREAFIEDVALLAYVEINVVLVHGGGPAISGHLERLAIESSFERGHRVTDWETMQVVEMILSGSVNKAIAADLCRHGIRAVGISGRDASLIRAKRKVEDDQGDPIDLGYVGEVASVDAGIVADLVEGGYLPVISPIGDDGEGRAYNINADHVAAAISAALGAEKLILLTDVPGLCGDLTDPASLISKLTASEIDGLIESRRIFGGMIPKMRCCQEAISGGTHSVHLIDGRREHGLLMEVFTDAGIGTMITKGEEGKENG
jgi:acetylglutamate kinase